MCPPGRRPCTREPESHPSKGTRGDKGTQEDARLIPGPEQEGAGSPATTGKGKPAHHRVMGTDTRGLWRAGGQAAPAGCSGGLAAHGTALTPQDLPTATLTVHLPNPATQRLQSPAPGLQPASFPGPVTNPGSSRRASPAGGRQALWLPRLTTFPPAPTQLRPPAPHEGEPSGKRRRCPLHDLRTPARSDEEKTVCPKEPRTQEWSPGGLFCWVSGKEAACQRSRHGFDP